MFQLEFLQLCVKFQPTIIFSDKKWIGLLIGNRFNTNLKITQNIFF